MRVTSKSRHSGDRDDVVSPLLGPAAVVTHGSPGGFLFPPPGNQGSVSLASRSLHGGARGRTLAPSGSPEAPRTPSLNTLRLNHGILRPLTSPDVVSQTGAHLPRGHRGLGSPSPQCSHRRARCHAWTFAPVSQSPRRRKADDVAGDAGALGRQRHGQRFPCPWGGCWLLCHVQRDGLKEHVSFQNYNVWEATLN